MYMIGNIVLGLKLGKSNDKFGEHRYLVLYLFPFQIMFIIDNHITDFRVELLDQLKLSISLQFGNMREGR